MKLVKACDIYVPNKNVDIKKWAVVACDQYTSEEEYWQDVEQYVGSDPSTLKIIYPEVYLEEGLEKKEARLNKINKLMREYIDDETIIPLKESMILVDRAIDIRHRIGVICSIDLEEYDYNIEKEALIRATEQTITSRIPPRLEIRKDAVIELPHILILIDDPKREIIENLYTMRNDFEKIYDFELMKNGGNIKGYCIKNSELIEDFNRKIVLNIKDKIAMVVGDGNHSLATAKDHWNNIKKDLTAEMIENHPARYALVEIENVYDEGLDFLPIHRSIFNINPEKFVKQFKDEISGNGKIQFYYNGQLENVNVSSNSIESVKQVQNFIDKYLKENKEVSVDYIYGDENLKYVCDQKQGLGILMNPIEKGDLFQYVGKKQVLPKKTFSMGNAYEKRYYIESKIIKA